MKAALGGSVEQYIVSVKKDVDDAWNIINSLENRSHFVTYDEEIGSYYDEEYEYHADLLESKVLIIYEKISSVLILAGLDVVLEGFRAGFNQHEDKLRSIVYTRFVGSVSNEALEYLVQYMSVIEPLSTEYKQIDLEYGRHRLERMLNATPVMINDKGIDPKNENEVRNTVYDVLKISHPDSKREVVINHTVKSYKMDIGIISLKAGIEYKFCDSEKEVKKAIEGICSDESGYRGSMDWTRFYAVLYMTEMFFTQDQIEKEFELVELDSSWVPIIVTGRGGRKRG